MMPELSAHVCWQLLDKEISMNVIYDKVACPVKHTGYVPVPLTKQTMQEHREKILSRMRKLDLDVLMVYADREHGSNYAYLTGL